MTSQCCVHHAALFQLTALSTVINTQQCGPENKIKSVKSDLRGGVYSKGQLVFYIRLSSC